MIATVEDHLHPDKDLALVAMMMSIPDAMRATGLSRSRVYQLLATGEISAKKCGRLTLIQVSSLQGYLDSLPPAVFAPRPPRRFDDAPQPRCGKNRAPAAMAEARITPQ